MEWNGIECLYKFLMRNYLEWNIIANKKEFKNKGFVLVVYILYKRHPGKRSFFFIWIYESKVQIFFVNCFTWNIIFLVICDFRDGGDVFPPTTHDAVVHRSCKGQVYQKYQLKVVLHIKGENKSYFRMLFKNLVFYGGQMWFLWVPNQEPFGSNDDEITTTPQKLDFQTSKACY